MHAHTHGHSLDFILPFSDKESKRASLALSPKEGALCDWCLFLFFFVLSFVSFFFCSFPFFFCSLSLSFPRGGAEDFADSTALRGGLLRGLAALLPASPDAGLFQSPVASPLSTHCVTGAMEDGLVKALYEQKKRKEKRRGKKKSDVSHFNSKVQSCSPPLISAQ